MLEIILTLKMMAILKKVRIEGLSRNNRRDFVSYYNENCKVDYIQETCPMIVEGELS